MVKKVADLRGWFFLVACAGGGSCESGAPGRNPGVSGQIEGERQRMA